MISSFASYGIAAIWHYGQNLFATRPNQTARSIGLTYSGLTIDAIVTGAGRRRFFAPLAALTTTAYILAKDPFPLFTQKGQSL